MQRTRASIAHFAPRTNQHLPGEHHLFVCGDALRHHHLIALALAELDRPEFCGGVRFDHVNEGPFLADLRCLIRNQNRCFFRGQHELDIHELTRPEMAIGIVQRGAQVNRAAAVLHGVIQKLDPAISACVRGIGGKSNHRCERATRHLSLNFRQIALGNRKVGIDGIEPLNGQQGSGVGLHHVAYIHQASPGSAVDGRVNVAILEVELRRLQAGLRGFHLRLIDIDGILLGVVVLLRYGFGPDHFLIASELNLRQIECRLRLRQRRFRRVNLRLVRTRIDDKQQLPLLQILAVLEMPFGDAPSHLRRHRDRLKGAVPSDFVQILGNILGCRLDHGNQGRRHGRRSLHIASAAGRDRQQRQQARRQKPNAAYQTSRSFSRSSSLLPSPEKLGYDETVNCETASNGKMDLKPGCSAGSVELSVAASLGSVASFPICCKARPRAAITSSRVQPSSSAHS